MGILREPADFVRALALPAGFSVCELGNQFVSYDEPASPASAFYHALGAGRYVSIDGNGRGTLTADLNRPIELREQFDLVTDFGTGEHIFDQAQVWRTLHQLAKPGGYVVIDRPLQGYPGHGFYLIDESLVWDLATANGYRMIRCEKGKTPRGSLLRAAFRLPDAARAFAVPQQGRYRESLRAGGVL